MKIAYLSLLAPPDQPAASGVLKVSETLLRQFESRRDIRVEAITLVDGLPGEIIRERGSVRYHYLPCRPKGKTATFYWFEQRKLRRRVRELGVDMIHGQPSGEYLLAATGSGFPNVITIHGLVFRETAGLGLFSRERLAGWTRENLQRRAVRRAKHIISISPYVDDYLAGWSHARLWPVANPIDPEFFEIQPPRHEGLRIICVGIVSERKNQALLIQACGRLQRQGIPFECRIVGQFSPGVDERIGGLIRELGLLEKVVLTGRISRDELFKQYAWSNLVALPSREETSPLSMIQGMASGRCVMGANAAGIPRLLRDGIFGTLFSGETPEDLASKLAQFASDPAPFWEKASASREFALASFQPSSVAQQTVDVYQQILGAQR